MKRGLITWDKREIPPRVFDERVGHVRQRLAEKQLDALVVYSDLWRSNSARFLSNYMPYFNRAFLILPPEGSPTLLCGLSPRVYGWIRSVTTIEDVRPAGNFARPLAQLIAERQWKRLGCLELEKLPWDLHRALFEAVESAVEISSLELGDVFRPGSDASEILMRRKIAAAARQILGDEISTGVGRPDHRLVGRIERRLRLAGVEDLVTLITNGDAPPAPPIGAILKEHFSISLAVEYRGHWVRLSRPNASEEIALRSRGLFDAVLANPTGAQAMFEDLSGSYPYECMDPADLRPGSLVAVHVEVEDHGRRFFYGDTCIYGESGLQTL